MKLVILGASAGGLEPLEEFFAKVPLDTDMTFLVVQHLASNHKSLMDELLSRRTKLPIKTVTSEVTLRPGHIYLNTSANLLLFDQSKVLLQERTGSKLDFPINRTFQSAAENFGENVAAVVLSGTGSDGSQGLKSIKESGGFTLVESPEEAKFSGMPNSAIRTLSVDAVLDVSQMYGRLQRFFSLSRDETKHQAMKELGAIITTIKDKTRNDFSGYKESTIIRRIERRLAVTNRANFQDYHKLIKDDSQEMLNLTSDLLIGVTSLFRDKPAFNAIEEKVFPHLLENESKKGEIRVWVPGCSTGEEAYTLAILLHRYLKRQGENHDVTIFATDLNGSALKKAANRVFEKSIIDDVPTDILQEYFIAKDGGYVPAGFLRKMIVFSVHNLIQNPPFSKIDLISCRNLLIYLKSEVQNDIINSFRYSLKKGGYLFLGASETLGSSQGKFLEVDRKWKIFKNTNRVQVPETTHYKKHSESGDGVNVLQGAVIPAQNKKETKTLQESIIQQFLPGSIVFNENLEIEHIIGEAEKVISFKKGAVYNNLLHLLPEKWRVSIEVGFSRLKKSGKNVEISGMEADTGKIYDVELGSLNTADLIGNFFTLVLKDPARGKETKEVLNLNIDNNEKVKLLESELRESKENLQTNIEELESSNEELQASNEELQSSNEELESLNEELYTVNSEYQLKVQELSAAHNDLKNLLNNTDIAILFLDDELKIRTFTKSIGKVLNIKKKDEGRSINDFQGKINFQKYKDEIDEVLSSLQSFEKTVETDDGEIYVLKINPFITTSNEIKGVIISLSDITKITKAEGNLASALADTQELATKLQQKQRNYEIIAEHSNDLVCLHDSDGKFTFISPSIEFITGYTANELMGRNFLDFVHPNDLKGVINLRDLISVESHARNFFRFKCKSGEYVWFNTSASFVDSGGNSEILLTSSRDVTENMKLTNQLRKYETIIKNALNSIFITNEKGETIFMNNAAIKNHGYTLEEMRDKKPGDLLQGEDTNYDDIAEISEAIKQRKPIQKNLLNYTKSGEKYWIDTLIQPLFDAKGELEGFFSVQRDITDEKEQQQRLEALNARLEKTNKKLKGANQQLEEFAYVVSHDLKEPARGVAGLMQMLESNKTKLDAEELKAIEMAQQASERMVKMIDSILSYSRTGKPKEARKLVSLNRVIDTTRKSVSHQAQKVNAEYILPNKDIEIWVYAQTFSQLLQNLFSNAIKYRSKKPLRIEVYFEENEDSHFIKVKDNGQGIKKEDHQKIFKIFNRVTEKQRNESHGIGLATCKRIAELHGGEISVESELGKGSTFTIEIDKKVPKNEKTT